MNDTELVALLKKGDEEAFSEIVKLYSNYVSAVIINKLGYCTDISEIEELSSDVFLKLWQNKTALKTNHLRGFIASTAKNVAKNHARRKRILFEEITENTVVISDDSLFSKLEADEKEQMLKSALNSMKKEDADVLIRYYYYDQTTGEIARITGENVNTIKSRLHRAGVKLKQILEEGSGFDGYEKSI